MQGSFITQKISRTTKSSPQPSTPKRRGKPDYSQARKLKESSYVYSE